MKLKIIIAIALILVAYNSVFAQSIDKISRQCPPPNKTLRASATVATGGILFTPCPNQGSFFENNIRLIDSLYNSTLNGGVNNNYFNIGTNTRFSIPNTNGLVADAMNIPVTINGTSKTYVGRQTWLDFQGTPTSPSIIGQWTNIASNALFPAGTGVIYGNYNTVNVGAQVNQAVSGHFTVTAGGAGASGVANLTAVLGVNNMAHNGNTTNAFGGDFFLTSSASTPSVVSLASGIRSRVTMQTGVTATTLNGLAVSDWQNLGGDIDNIRGIFIDSSIDTFPAISIFAIKSLSVSPSQFNGDVYLSNIARGIVLKSPDGTCYRYTAANGGALNAGVVVTCPA